MINTYCEFTNTSESSGTLSQKCLDMCMVYFVCTQGLMCIGIHRCLAIPEFSITPTPCLGATDLGEWWMGVEFADISGALGQVSSLKSTGIFPSFSLSIFFFEKEHVCSLTIIQLMHY